MSINPLGPIIARRLAVGETTAALAAELGWNVRHVQRIAAPYRTDLPDVRRRVGRSRTERARDRRREEFRCVDWRLPDTALARRLRVSYETVARARAAFGVPALWPGRQEKTLRRLIPEDDQRRREAARIAPTPTPREKAAERLGRFLANLDAA